MECSDYVVTNSDGTSYSDSNNYYKECTLVSDCDAKIYVSFLGTDASGNYMESAGIYIIILIKKVEEYQDLDNMQYLICLVQQKMYLVVMLMKYVH